MVSWKKFENHVKELAALKWGMPARSENIGGTDFDVVVKVNPKHIIIIECTERMDLAKIREDIYRLNNAREPYFRVGVFCETYIILQSDPTGAMLQNAAQHNIEICSLETFEQSVFNFNSYYNLRSNKAFGSAVDGDGETDKVEYIEVSYIDEQKNRNVPMDRIVDFLISKKKIVMMGDYGTGKSRCLKEVFEILSNRIKEDSGFPIAIDLKKHWGSQNKIEILLGHMQSVGMSASYDSIVRLMNSGNLIFLLDGFDEVGAQTLDFERDFNDEYSIRLDALKGVRDLISDTKCGVLITGRSHYFDSDNDMLACLGLSEEGDRLRVLHSPEEFDLEQSRRYLINIGMTDDLPKWLPRKPLIFQLMSKFNPEEKKEIFVGKDGELAFWSILLNTICKREARMSPALDPSAIEAVLIELAYLTRVHPEPLGIITQSNMAEAYQRALGVAPDESGAQMLSRLCALGRIGPDTPNRQFIDEKLLDVLKAEKMIDDIFRMDIDLDSKYWLNTINITGVYYAARKIEAYDMEGICLNIINRCIDRGGISAGS